MKFETEINEFIQILNNSINKQKIHQDLFESIYANTVEYFDYYLIKRKACNLSKSKTSHSNDDEEKFLFNPICHVIPTIALFTGINFQDYASLCDNLSLKLQNEFSENLFLISEKNSQNIKSLANSLFSQLENSFVNFK